MAKFETKVCGRCGGSGSYSFNLMHGTMCYGCRGSGEVLTKRGLAAKLFFEDSLSVTAENVKVGDIIRCWAGINKFYAVTSVTAGTMPDGRPVVELHMDRAVYRCMPEEKIRIGFGREDKATRLAAALEYQASLTAQGKVSKKSLKKV